ncbi:DUF3098 domain-containing protein [Ferruginibacter sp. HRS2-29]|uniref:DUF3098 domain-containing protein n=1 Tax=Ferruginibacter sp. HRS2-29 TaxID=2487334 RepID=UPI0020CCC8A3|nr:DUF3098 domain-containing protein [Ferruginibacter sp. HRS2-29]MCP9752539.1 DUF3098 domain-containing protein [Ferruginibacter sp. HRS2-29]
MENDKKQPVAPVNSSSLFGKDNYIWMIAGLVVIGIGFLLMAGGKSDNPGIFNKDEVYSATRITVAPLVIIIGFIVEIYAILKTPKKDA